jgi:hypothetical protein
MSTPIYERLHHTNLLSNASIRAHTRVDPRTGKIIQVAAHEDSRQSAQSGGHKKGDWVYHPKTRQRGVVSHVYEPGESGAPDVNEHGRLVEVDYGHTKGNIREKIAIRSRDQMSKWASKPKED